MEAAKLSGAERFSRAAAVTLAVAVPLVGLVLALYLFGIIPLVDLSARPAQAYETTADLATALNEGGVECDFRQQEPGRKVDPGFCRDPEAAAGVGLFLRNFDNDETLARFVRGHRECGYERAVVGDGWMIVVHDKAEAAAVLEAVGGRVVEGGVC